MVLSNSNHFCLEMTNQLAQQSLVFKSVSCYAVAPATPIFSYSWLAQCWHCTRTSKINLHNSKYICLQRALKCWVVFSYFDSTSTASTWKKWPDHCISWLVIPWWCNIKAWPLFLFICFIYIFISVHKLLMFFFKCSNYIYAIWYNYIYLRFNR